MTVSAAQITGSPGVAYNDASQPVAGEVQAYAGASAPTGWAFCDGSEISQTTYADLFAAIGSTYNTQTNPTTGAAWAAPAGGNFRVPDFRGLYLRGVGTPSGQSAVTLGLYQAHKTAINGLGLSNGSYSLSGSAPSLNNNSVAPANHGHALLTSGADTLVVQGLTTGGTNKAVETAIAPAADLRATTNGSGATSVGISGGSYSLSGTAPSIGTGDSETRPLTKGINWIIRLFNPTKASVGVGLVTSVTPGLRNFETPQTNLTVSGTGWATTRAVGVAYADNNGVWRLKFNVAGTVPSSSRTSYTASISGTVFKSGQAQAISSSWDTSTQVAKDSYVGGGTGNLIIGHATNTTTGYYWGGDVELDGKPSWA